MGLSAALWVPAILLFVAAAWDLATTEIPDVFPLLLVAWAVASRLIGYQETAWLQPALGLALGLAVGLALFTLGWLGGGDGKLLGGLGAVLGPVGLLATLPWIALVGLPMAIWAGRRGHEEMTYGPAIALGYAVALVV